MKVINKLLIHPVDFDCNMACGYCYNGSCCNQTSAAHRIISDEILYKVFNEIADFLDGDKLMVIWHGGEPLLAGKDFYRKAITIQKSAAKGRYSFRNCIQTNGTLVDNEWVDILKDLKIAPSVSIDGPAIFHDQVRRFHDGAPTYDLAMDAYNSFRKYGKTGLLIVISKVNVDYPEIIWQWILERGIKSFDFLPCLEPELYKQGKTILTVDEEEMSKFSIKLFDLWFNHADPSIRIRTFKDAIKGQLGGKVNVCSWKGGCLSHVSIDPNGNVFPCGRYHCFPETSFGNLMTNNFAEIMHGSRSTIIREQIDRGQQRCDGCKWYKICNSGCPFLKYALNGSWNSHYVHCQSRQALLAHVREKISK